MAESVTVTGSLLGSQPGSLKHSQRTLGVPASHWNPGGYMALPRSSAVPVETRGFPSMSLCRKLLLCFAHPFQAVGTGAGETTKHKNAAQVSPGCSMVLQREQRRQLTAKEIWAWDWSTEVRTRKYKSFSHLTQESHTRSCQSFYWATREINRGITSVSTYYPA